MKQETKRIIFDWAIVIVLGTLIGFNDGLPEPEQIQRLDKARQTTAQQRAGRTGSSNPLANGLAAHKVLPRKFHPCIAPDGPAMEPGELRVFANRLVFSEGHGGYSCASIQ